MRLPELRRLVTSALMTSAAHGQLAVDPTTCRQPYLLVAHRAIPLPSRTARLFDREINRGHLIVTQDKAIERTADGRDVLVVTTVNGKAA